MKKLQPRRWISSMYQPAMKCRRQGHPQKIATKTTKKVVIFAITSSSFEEVWSPLLLPANVFFLVFQKKSQGAKNPPEKEHSQDKQSCLPGDHHHSKFDLRAVQTSWGVMLIRHLPNFNPAPAWTLLSSCNPQVAALAPNQSPLPPPLRHPPSKNYPLVILN